MVRSRSVVWSRVEWSGVEGAWLGGGAFLLCVGGGAFPPLRVGSGAAFSFRLVVLFFFLRLGCGAFLPTHFGVVVPSPSSV